MRLEDLYPDAPALAYSHSPTLNSVNTPRWTIGPLPQEDAAELFAASEASMATLYPAESNHFVGPDVFAAEGNLLIGVFVEQKPVGCVGWVMTSATEAEVKRLFVDEYHRSAGVGRALMEALHDHAKKAGLTVLRLETGIHQVESLSLYRSLGYRDIEPFGDYAPDPLSIFMEISLQPDAAVM